MSFDWLYINLLTNKRVHNKRGFSNLSHSVCETKQTNDLKSEIEATVNRCLEAMTTILTKVEVVGVNLQVIEVKKLEFDIYF